MRLALTDGWVDLGEGEIVRSGQRTPIPPLERRLLGYLATRPGQAVAVHELHREVWGAEARLEARAVYYTVRRLRQRLEPDPGKPTVLTGSEARGFVLRPSQSHGSAPFVGRGSELRRVLELLDRPGALAVVTGPSGIGKSRLLEEVARGLPRVVTVDAEGAVDPRGLRSAIGRDLGVDLGTEQAVGAVVAARIGDGTLILDQADRLEADAFAALERWRRAAPGMRILAARPGPAPVSGAQHVALGPLPLEDARVLFRLRASSGGGTPGSETELDALLGQLDGLPLAIVLAAWRAGRLPLALVRKELEVALSSLAVPLYDLPARHHSLEAAIAFSVAGASTAEQAGIRVLSGIDAPLPQGAAVALLVDAGARHTLDALVERGLVRPRRAFDHTVYEVLVGVRRFLADPAIRTVAARRFAAWWVSEPRTPTAERRAGRCLLEVGAALVELGDVDLSPLIVTAALRAGLSEGATPERNTLVTRALALPLDPATRARIGWFAARLGGPPYRVDVMRRALAELERTADPADVVDATLHYAYVFAHHADMDEDPRTLVKRVRSLAASSDRVASIAFVESHLARIAGAFREAESHLERVGDPADERVRALVRIDRSLIRSNLGHPAEALAIATAEHERASHADPHMRANTSWSVAWALWSDGRFREARATLATARAETRPFHPYRAAWFGVMEGFAALGEGCPGDARALLVEALGVMDTLGNPDEAKVAQARVGVALARLRLGEGGPYTGIDPDAPSVRALPAEDEIELRSYCAEIAARSGDPVAALRHLEAAEARMARTDLAATSVPGRALTAARAVVRGS